MEHTGSGGNVVRCRQRSGILGEYTSVPPTLAYGYMQGDLTVALFPIPSRRIADVHPLRKGALRT